MSLESGRGLIPFFFFPIDPRHLTADVNQLMYVFETVPTFWGQYPMSCKSTLMYLIIRIHSGEDWFTVIDRNGRRGGLYE